MTGHQFVDRGVGGVTPFLSASDATRKLLQVPLGIGDINFVAATVERPVPSSDDVLRGRLRRDEFANRLLGRASRSLRGLQLLRIQRNGCLGPLDEADDVELLLQQSAHLSSVEQSGSMEHRVIDLGLPDVCGLVDPVARNALGEHVGSALLTGDGDERFVGCRATTHRHVDVADIGGPVDEQHAGGHGRPWAPWSVQAYASSTCSVT